MTIPLIGGENDGKFVSVSRLFPTIQVATYMNNLNLELELTMALVETTETYQLIKKVDRSYCYIKGAI